MPEIDFIKVGLHILNVLIMLVILRLLIYKPVLKFIKKREHAFWDKTEGLEDREKQLVLREKKYEEIIEEAQTQAETMIINSNKLSKEHAREIIETAREQAKDILDRAAKEIDAEKAQALVDMRSEIAQMSVQIAKKVIEREITVEDNRKIIDEFFERVG